MMSRPITPSTVEPYAAAAAAADDNNNDDDASTGDYWRGQKVVATVTGDTIQLHYTGGNRIR